MIKTPPSARSAERAITFDHNGIAASDDRLRSIALDCLRAERAAIAAARAARAAGATESTWSVNW